MKLDEARIYAETIRAALAPACAKCEIVGSVRRCKPDEIKDVELVMVSAPFRPVFGGGFGSPLERLMDELLERGVLRKRLDKNGRPAWGVHYRRAWWNMPEGAALIPLDLFICEPGNFGALFALRTGPDDFSRRLVTPRRFGGAMPIGMKQEDGWLWRMTKSTDWERVGVQEESDYFSALGLPTLPPRDRTEARLMELLRVKA